MTTAGDSDGLVAALLETHYDPLYARSLARNFSSLRDSRVFEAGDVSQEAFRTLAAEVRAAYDPVHEEIS
jgi:hypothetical protein